MRYEIIEKKSLTPGEDYFVVRDTKTGSDVNAVTTREYAEWWQEYRETGKRPKLSNTEPV